MDDGLTRAPSSLVVAPDKERRRAPLTSQCCHCASVTLLPGLQCRRDTPWEVVDGANTLALVRPMHKNCYSVINATPPSGNRGKLTKLKSRELTQTSQDKSTLR